MNTKADYAGPSATHVTWNDDSDIIIWVGGCWHLIEPHDLRAIVEQGLPVVLNDVE